MRFILINGHWDTQGSPVTLLADAGRSAKKEMEYYGEAVEIQMFHLKLIFKNHYDGPDAPTPQVVADFLNLMVDKETVGFIFGSAITWDSVTDRIHTLKQYCYPLESPTFPLRGKPFGVVVHGNAAGGPGALASLSHMLSAELDMVPVPTGQCYQIKNGKELSEEQHQITDPITMGQNLARFVLMQHRCPIDLNGWRPRVLEVA